MSFIIFLFPIRKKTTIRLRQATNKLMLKYKMPKYFLNADKDYHLGRVFV
jgi:hypothetical protein